MPRSGGECADVATFPTAPALGASAASKAATTAARRHKRIHAGVRLVLGDGRLLPVCANHGETFNQTFLRCDQLKVPTRTTSAAHYADPTTHVCRRIKICRKIYRSTPKASALSTRKESASCVISDANARANHTQLRGKSRPYLPIDPLTRHP